MRRSADRKGRSGAQMTSSSSRPRSHSRRAGTKRRRKLRVIDLFAGCGGLTQGLDEAGFRVVGAIERDELAAQAYKLNHPNVRLWRRDIRRVSVADVRKKLRLARGRVELLAGCPPCQGFSNIRTRNGRRRVRDKRNNLVREFMRFVRGLAPKTVMFENVPGLATKRRFKELVAQLKELGYEVNWSILDAADYGVPQRRRRLILVASKGTKIPFGAEARVRRNVRDAIGDLVHPRHSRDPHHAHAMKTKRSVRIRKLISMIPRNGGSRTDLSRRHWLACHKRCDGFKDVYGRMRWSQVAPTITGGCLNPSKGRFLHPTHNRPITIREASLLQGFPKSYKFPFGAGSYSLAELIGNALPPEFVRRHAVSIRRALLNRPTRAA